MAKSNFFWRVVHQHGLLALMALATLGMLLIFWYIWRLSSVLVESAAVQDAAHYSEAIAEFRSLYTSEVVEVVRKQGITVTHDYRKEAGSIPLPATLSMLLGKKIGEKKSGAVTYLYSPYPFPWRKEEGGLKDRFAEEAWSFLQTNPDQSYYQLDTIQGRRVIRYATADVLRPNCVSCHNSHADSPRRGWQAGDVRGILEVVLPLDTVQETTRERLYGTFVLLTASLLVGLSVLGVVIHRLRRATTDLAQSVAELEQREARIQALNEDLTALNSSLEQRVKERTEQAHWLRDKAEQANRAKSEFLSRMSHELRTPLNAILGFGQLLLREPLPARQREHLDYIVKAGRHLLNLINEVLDITRIEVGRLVVAPELVRLADALAEVSGLTQPMANARGIRMSVEPAPALDWAVIANKQQLKQVLLNLLSNAVKYNIDKGSVTVRVEPTPEGRMRIHVEDTGQGIALDKQHRVFVPFDRLGAEATEVEGSGLGLVLSRRLVEIMGGTLTFTSRAGGGTTFTIELAQGRNTQPAPEGLPAAPAPAMAGPARTVLCIEDNEVNIRLIQAVLASRPAVRLLTAMQGSIALEMVRRDRPHLILLDVHLPDMDGNALLQTFRADPDLRDIPVIVISADATTHQIDRLLANGAGEYLTKPIDVEQLLRVLDRYLK